MSDTTAERWMRRAVQLAKRGYPAPNPRVGCVLVRNGEVVGEGWHEAAGLEHAEAMALRVAGDRARGADCYVTLEPCAHHGRTPPCARALIVAGVRRVFVSVADPNPIAQGGADELRSSGVDVHMGLLAELGELVNERFLLAMRQRRPFVTLKAATTLDGKIARSDGSSKWITGPLARREARRLRAEMGAVLVGQATVRADDPLLTSRLRGVRNEPVRVILDPWAELRGDEMVFRGPGAAMRVVAPEHAEADRVAIEMGERGLYLDALLSELFRRGITGLLVEGGGRTLRSFLEADLWDRLELFVAPKVFGEGLGWLGEGAIEATFRRERLRALGTDVQFSYTRGAR